MASIETVWKHLLWDCYNNGKNVVKDDSEIREMMGNYIFLERPQDIFIPGRQEINSPRRFLELMDQGVYDIKGYPFKAEALYDYVNSLNSDKHIFCSDKEEYKALFGEIEKPCNSEVLICNDDICEENSIPKPFVYTYPERIIHQYNIVDFDPEEDLTELGYLNQFDIILNRLRTNDGTNRAVATIYHPGLDKEREDIPCLNWLQATIRDDKLELHVMFRSNDLYGAWPSNMYFLTYLGLCLTDQFIKIPKPTFNGIHYHSSSLHIYKSNLDAVKKILDAV